MSSNTPSPEQITGLLIRVNTLEQQLQQVQPQLQQVQAQLRDYVPVTINDLQLQDVRKTVDRIEREVSDTRREVTEIRRELGGIKTKLVQQENEQQQANILQKMNQYKFQSRALWWIVSSVILALLAILVAVIEHWII